MAEKRTQTPTGPIVAPEARSLLLEKYRAMSGRTPETSDAGNGAHFRRPWHGYVRDLEAGKPFTCQRWQLPAPVQELLPAGSAYEWWRLDGDTLTRTESPVQRDEVSTR